MNTAAVAVVAAVVLLLLAVVVSVRVRSIRHDRGKPVQREVVLRQHWLVQEWPHTRSLGERWVCVPPNTPHDCKWPGIKFFGTEEAAREFVSEQVSA